MKNLHWPIVYLKLVAAGNVIQYNVILQKIEVHYISCKYKDKYKDFRIQYTSFRSTLIIIMSCMLLWYVWIFPFFVWFQFCSVQFCVVDKGSIQSQAGTRQNVWHDAFHCVVDITTQFGDSSAGNSFIFCLELQYFLSIWKYSSNPVHHCTLYLYFLWKYRSVLLSAMYLEEVHMSTSLQMWVDVFWRSSSFPRQLTSNFCPEMYLCFTLFIDLHIIRTCIFTILVDLYL